MSKKLLAFLALPSLCLALEEQPWFCHLYQFEFRSEYNYNFFDDVDNAKPQLNERFNTHELDFALDLTYPETWNWETEIEFADTSNRSFNYRSFALQGRKLLFDDLCYDIFSLTFGFSYRHASKRMLDELSTPYHGTSNFEFHTALGKEWSQGCYWCFRTYGLFAVGQATRGSPWLRGDLILKGNYCDRHQLSLYAKSYFGLGDKTVVELDDFNGWAKIAHHSVDLGVGYCFLTDIYGSLRFDYRRRVYAHSYPEKVNFFIFTYELSFCPF